MQSGLRSIIAGSVLAVVLSSLGWADVERYRGAHTGDDVILLASTLDGEGQLAGDYPFSVPVLLSLDVAQGGLARYSATDPFFEILEDDDPAESLYRIDDGTEVVFEIVAIDPAISVRIKGTNLLDAGDTVVMGTMPDLHTDPGWQLTLPEGEVDCRQVSFRLVTAAAQYGPSETHTVTLTNDPARACARTCGDADGDGTITVTDGVNVLRAAAGLTSSCAEAAVCDVDGNGVMSVTDGVNVLRAAAGLSANLACPAL